MLEIPDGLLERLKTNTGRGNLIVVSEKDIRSWLEDPSQ